MEYTFPQRGAAATAAPHVGLFSHAEGSDRTTSPRSFTEWASWEVAEYLSRLQLGHHVDAFMDADVDGDALAYLDADLLNDLGVASVGQRLKLLRAVFDMKAEEGLEPDGVGWAPPSAAVQASIQSSYIQSHHDRLGLLESELAYYREEVDSLQVLVHALGENSKSVPQLQTDPEPEARSAPKSGRRKLSVDTSGQKKPEYKRDSLTPIGETSRPVDTPLDSSAMPTGLMVSTPSSGALTPGPNTALETSNKRFREALRTPSADNDLVTKPLALQRPSLAKTTNRLARSSPNLRREEATLSPPGAARTDKLRHSEHEPAATSPSKRPQTTGKRSGTQDTCFKVLPAAVKVRVLVHLNQHSNRAEGFPLTEVFLETYAMIVTWAGQKRVLSYDEKPRVVVHRLREQGEQPSCLVQHLTELKSPLNAAASRRSKMFRSYIDDPKSVNDPSGIPPQQLPVLMTEQALSPEIKNRLPPNTKYALTMFPYCAEKEDELDTEYGDCLSVIAKYDGFVEVTKAGEEKLSKTKTARVPVSTILPIYTLPTSRAGGPLTLDTNLIGAQFTTLYAQIDRSTAVAGEVPLIKGEKVRVYAKASHWCFLVKGGDRTFGWAPSWHLGGSSGTSGGDSVEGQRS